MLAINPIIVNYRTPALTLNCVESMLQHGVAAASDIIVVENGSSDESEARLRSGLPKNVKLLVMGQNRGLSAGINAGSRCADAPLLLVLNPDTYFVDRSISKAVDRFCEKAQVGLIGLDLTYPSGDRQFSARRFYSLVDILGRRSPLGRFWPLKARVERHMMLSAWATGSPFETDWVMGTGFLVRRSLFEQIGRMDETYFLYMEDVDLCARVWGVGATVECIPGAVLIHDHQRASRSGPFSKAGKIHMESLRIFRQKYRLPLFFPPTVRDIRRDGESHSRPRPGRVE